MIKKFIDPFEIAFIKEIIGMDIRIDDPSFTLPDVKKIDTLLFKGYYGSFLTIYTVVLTWLSLVFV